MNRDHAIATLLKSEPALRARGVRRAALFGSVARGETSPDSDIDIMIATEFPGEIICVQHAEGDVARAAFKLIKRNPGAYQSTGDEFLISRITDHNQPSCACASRVGRRCSAAAAAAITEWSIRSNAACVGRASHAAASTMRRIPFRACRT